ncbi:Chemotaxis protein CheA [Janthinobacterium lividum]|nr:Chemotaxis protein CheA [Janthinobacterium lividum]
MSQDQHGDLSAFSMLDLFRMEADSQTQILTDGLLAMERHAGDAAAVEAMMRAAHSIKGAAAIVGLQVVVQLAHGMEDSFVAAQHGRLKLTPERVDVLLSGVDLIVQLSRLDDAGAEAWLAANAAQIDQTLNAIAGIADLPELPALPPAPAPMSAPLPPEAAEPQVPVASGLAGEEAEAAAPAPRTATGAGAPAKAQAQNFDKLLSLASESRINAHQMHPFVGALQRFKRNQSSLFSAIEHLHEAIARSADPGLMEKSLLALQKTQPLKQFMLEHIADIETYERRLLAVSQGMVDEVLALRMRPFRDGIHAFPRMVRDLARSLGKEVQLEIDGEDTLVDRDILAKIESPLNHMLRNAIDHGMEGPYERIDGGKEALGTIRMEARHRAGMLSIEISDDGRGVDLEKIRQSVIERKMASPAMAAALSPGELLEFCSCPPSA